MYKKLIEDIIEWDIHNWSQSLGFWEKYIQFNPHLKCLELGGRKGGLSLWLAANNCNVICSDLSSPKKLAVKIHEKYGCAKKVEYQAIDATNIPYENEFDLVVFKSVLGGVSRNNNDHLKQKVISEISKSLKPSGKLLFVENMEGAFIHQFLRKKFLKWGKSWNYLKYEELETLFSPFESFNYETVGFFGAFGRNERQRKVLGKFDSIFKFAIPKSKRYIVIGVAEKSSR